MSDNDTPRLHPDDMDAIAEAVVRKLKAQDSPDGIAQKLTTIEGQLSALLVPVAAQAGKQMAEMSYDEIKANNKILLRKSRLRRAALQSEEQKPPPK